MQFYHFSIFQNLRACFHLAAMHHAASDNIVFTCHILFPPLSVSLAVLSHSQNGSQKRLIVHCTWAPSLPALQIWWGNHSKVDYTNNPCPFIIYLRSYNYSYFMPWFWFGLSKIRFLVQVIFFSLTAPYFSQCNRSLLGVEQVLTPPMTQEEHFWIHTANVYW